MSSKALLSCATRYLGTATATAVLVYSTLVAPLLAADNPVAVAVASNFTPALRDLASVFEQQTGTLVQISSASTGKLYAQITNGAPFDVFLAADSKRPQLLEKSRLATANSRFTYAVGSLVLWSRDPDFKDADCKAQLTELGNKRLAIANPETAPYGAAAQQTLIKINAWEAVEARLVTGENIAQTLHFVATGNASLGFIAKTQALDERLPAATCSWQVPSELHQPIAQQAILLNRGNNPAAKAFLEFLQSPSGQAIIKRHGYTLPH